MIPNFYIKNGCFTMSIHLKLVVWGTRYISFLGHPGFEKISWANPNPRTSLQSKCQSLGGQSEAYWDVLLVLRINRWFHPYISELLHTSQLVGETTQLTFRIVTKFQQDILVKYDIMIYKYTLHRSYGHRHMWSLIKSGFQCNQGAIGCGHHSS